MVNPVFLEEHTPPFFSHTSYEREARIRANELFDAHNHLCRRGARKFVRTGVEYCDLEQVAAIGLIKASRRFDESSKTPFEAYAWLIIVGELMHYVRDHERLVRVPRRLKVLEVRMNHARDTFMARSGRDPRDAELAREMGVDAPTLLEVRAASSAARVHTLDDAAVRRFLMVNELAPDDRLLVTEAVARLSAVQRRVIVGVDVLGITQLELGRLLGLSPRCVSRVRRAALVSMQRSWAAS